MQKDIGECTLVTHTMRVSASCGTHTSNIHTRTLMQPTELVQEGTSWLMSSSMDVHVEAVVLQLWEVLAAHRTGAALVLAVRAPHVAVVCRVRGEGFATVLALEGLLSRVLADVCAQDAGGCKRLGGHRRKGGGRAGRGVSGLCFMAVEAQKDF